MSDEGAEVLDDGTARDWVSWHQRYDEPGSALAHRLTVVREQIRVALDRVPAEQLAAGPVRVVSMCAGQGRDLFGALAGHPLAGRVRARLVELDPVNAAVARARAAELGVPTEVVVADAGGTDPYLRAVPAQLVLACGVYGNITMPDLRTTIALQPAFCAPGATVIWTRHRNPPDQIPAICDWYADHGFELLWLSDPDLPFGVGAHRYTGPPADLPPATRMFTFVGRHVLAARGEL